MHGEMRAATRRNRLFESGRRDRYERFDDDARHDRHDTTDRWTGLENRDLPAGRFGARFSGSRFAPSGIS